MAKKAILDVLEHTIGRYVLNLDAQSLNVAVWSGKIELHSLELDTYSINNELERQAHESPNLALPIRVLGGRFESLQVDVPWTKLTSKSVLFRAKGLFITIEPYNNSQAATQSSSKTETKKKNPRTHAIDIANEARLRTNAIRDLAEDDGSGDQSSFSSRLVRRILENLQVDIEDIHVSLKGCGASAGIVLDALSLVTTDENGERTFVDRASQKGAFLHKALNITDFGLYLDESITLNPRSSSEVSKSHSSSRRKHHSYILSPLSFQASLRQSDSVRCINFPKYLFTSKLSNMSIMLSRRQLELANKISKVIQPVKGMRPLFPEYRPNITIRKGTAKLWWKYAVRCIGRLTRRRSWTEFFLAYKKRKIYIPLYKQEIYCKSSSWIKSITPSDQVLLNKIDMDNSISVSGIMGWRNMADAQAKKERRKYEAARAKLAPEKTTGYRAFFRYQEVESTSTNDLDKVPISLTVGEMKELQNIDLEHIANAVLSSDSKLYDFNFSLESFKVNLFKTSLEPIVRLKMGQMKTNFNANNDGSYNFGFTLSSMQVDDMVTHGTLFSSIVHSLQSPSSSSFKHAFEFKSKKAKEGDQDIILKLVAFEIVASPEVLNEVKHFFVFREIKDISNQKMNPLLQQSVTGEADIFYDAVDANEVQPPSFVNTTAAAAAKATTKMSDKLSNALSEAWNQKKVRKRTWTMDCNIHAPILVIPENVKNPHGTVLVLDMGNLHVILGNNPSSKEVEAWYIKRIEKHRFYNEVDHWKLEMKNLTFLVGKAGNMDWKSQPSKIEKGKNAFSEASQAIVEPLSVSLSAGTENSLADFPLVCIHGVLPHISVKLSPKQLSRILSVVSTWQSFASDFSSEGELYSKSQYTNSQVGGETVGEKTNLESSMNLSQTVNIKEKAKPGPPSNLEPNLKSRISNLRENEIVSDWLHISLALRRLSAKFETDDGGSLEAHLVSVVVSQTNFIDDSSSLRLYMGWFWILDLLVSSNPRQQRLFAHSSLPKSSTTYASDENYCIMDDLETHGVFDKSYTGSTDLADISILKKPHAISEGNEAYLYDELDTFIDATFSSLYINWNPQSIKSLLLLKAQISSIITSSNHGKQSPPSQERNHFEGNYGSSATIASGTSNHNDKSHVRSSIKATMKKLELSLNSAKDDMPLYVLIMANSKLDTLSSYSENKNLEATFSVGNIRIQTPSGRTYKDYNTLIGLAPNQTSSLLSIKYCQGRQAIESSNLGNADKKFYEGFAEVELSPMRIVYIQAQIMALLEFVTNGVLGTVAAHVASSAKAAALEVANATQGQQLYQIKASGIDFVLPQAANLEKNFVLHAGAFLVRYGTLPDGSSEAKISLTDVLLESNTKFQVVASPIRMAIDAKLPSILAPTIEDRVTRINVNFSKASFLLSHEQYSQMMNTLSMNVGEADSFLRENVDIYGNVPAEDLNVEVTSNNPKNTTGGNLTHAGVSAVFVQKRMYLSFNFEEMCLGLGGKDEFDPILSLSAVQTGVLFQFLPDKEQMVTEMTLHNVEVEDRRRISQQRHFRSLVSQVEGHSDDVFKLSYVKSYHGSSSLDVVLGSPQVVILPDVITEVLNFMRIRSEEVSDEDEEYDDSLPSNKQNDQAIYLKEKEAHLQDSNMNETESKLLVTTTYSLKTSNCQFVLVDMGNETLANRKNYPKSTLEEVKELTEAVVFQGKVDTKMILTTNSLSGCTDSTKIQFQAEQMQLYTGEGRNLDSPVQILEPVNLAVHLTKIIRDEGHEEVELKAVSLSPIDMVFSMQNAALLNAILSSISDSLLASSTNDNMKVPNQLSQEETLRLEQLSLAMNEGNDWDSDGISILREAKSDVHISKTYSSSRSLSSQSKYSRRVTRINTTIPEIVITMINDLQGLDQALFKVIARNVVSGAEFNVPMHDPSSLNEVTFNAHVNASLLADFFDISTNLWANFLREPWEVTLSSKRSRGNKFNSNRFTTLLDIESHPCFISFSEQFLVGIGAAKQMWSMYSAAMSNASSVENIKDDCAKMEKNRIETTTRKSLAANAARALVTTMPYGINNRTGLTVEFFMINGEKKITNERQICQTGEIKFFRFESPRVQGIGGKRVYGQDVKHFRSLDVFIGASALHFSHIDAEVNRPRHAHRLEGGQFIFTEFVNTGKATILHLSSHVHVYNCTNIPFSVALQNSEGITDVGVCHGTARSKFSGKTRKKVSSISSRHNNDMMPTKYPSSLGIPTNLLHNFVIDTKGISEYAAIDLLFCPHSSDREFDCERDTPPRASTSFLGNRGSFRWGALYLPSVAKLVEIGSGDFPVYTTEVACFMPRDEMHSRTVGKSIPKNHGDYICVQISLKVTLVSQAHPFVEIFIQPRSTIENKLPVSILIRTPMPYTFSPPNEKGLCAHSPFDLHDHVNHRLDPQQTIEVFSPGPSIAIRAMCADGPIAGGVTGWCEEIIDIPLGIDLQSRLVDPIRCLFPFIGREGEFLTGGGSEFHVMESNAFLSKKDRTDDIPLQIQDDQVRTVFITVHDFIVDHTGRVLLEPHEKENFLSDLDKRRRELSRKAFEKAFLPWSAFASSKKGRRITLLPDASTPIHLVELTMQSNDGMKKSLPFKVDNISICEGGVESSAIMLENHMTSGYFAYRQLRSFGQSEVHIIPEFVAFNGSSENTIVIKQPQSNHAVIGPGKIAPLCRDHLKKLIIMIEVLDLSGSTAPIQVDELGMRICVVKSNKTGIPLGSIAIQTVVGGRDSRLVIKVGAVTFGGKERISEDTNAQRQTMNILADDFLRFRVRWTELKISLSDTQLSQESDSNSALKRGGLQLSKNIHDMIFIEIVFHNLTVDFQRIFKEDELGPRQIQSPERSQLSIVINKMRILDCLANSHHPIVLDGFTEKSVFDLCVRFRGPVNTELIKVELLDINLAYSKKSKFNTIILNASEDFIWRLLDVMHRITLAINDVAGFEMILDWNDELSEFEVSIIQTSGESYIDEANEVKYQPPRSDKLFDIRTARVSPIRLQFSFQRQPQGSRYYKRASSAPGAKLMNYFTHRLKFTIQNADLNFAGYVAKNMKGPLDRVVDTFKTYYVSRIKMQFVGLMTAVSLQDWKYLTNRELGHDEFEEGDVLRLTGNIAGSSVGYVFKKVGQGLGGGVSSITNAIGNEFEKTTELIGAGAVGVRVNNLVSGVGDGLGDTVKGVGNGAGKIIRGAGRGVGHIAGGLGGGVSLAVKGNFKEGAAAIGQGVGQGLETTVSGVADGVMNVGKGLFSGVRNIGTGIEGVFTGKKREGHTRRGKKR